MNTSAFKAINSINTLSTSIWMEIKKNQTPKIFLNKSVTTAITYQRWPLIQFHGDSASSEEGYLVLLEPLWFVLWIKKITFVQRYRGKIFYFKLNIHITLLVKSLTKLVVVFKDSFLTSDLTWQPSFSVPLPLSRVVGVHPSYSVTESYSCWGHPWSSLSSL